MTSVMRQVPVTTYPRLHPRSPVTMRIAAGHPSWPLFHPQTIDATAAVTRATSVAIAVNQSSRTSTPRVLGRGRRPTRRSKRACRRRVLLMSTQSFPVMAVLQIMTDGKERTKSANVAHGRSRSTATRSETDPSSAGEGDFVIWRCLRTLRLDQSHVFWTQW